MADILIKETGNGGDVLITGRDLALVTGWENMPYLSMFGGHIPGAADGDKPYWANDMIAAAGTEDMRFVSETEKTLRSVALNSAGRIKIEQAVLRDLQHIKDAVPGTVINVDVRIVSDDRVSIVVDIDGNTFEMNWNPDKIYESPQVPEYVPPPYQFHPYTQAYLDYIQTNIGNWEDLLITTGYTGMQNAIILDRLVRDLNGQNNAEYATVDIWGRFKAMYPIMGSYGDVHKLNIIDLTRNMSYSGIVTDGDNKYSTEVTGGYGDTGMVDGTDAQQDDMCIGVMVSGFSPALVFACYVVWGDPALQYPFIRQFFVGNYWQGGITPTAGGIVTAETTTANAFLHVSSNTSLQRMFKGDDGTQIGTNTYVAGTQSGETIKIGGFVGGTILQAADMDVNFGYIGKSLTDSERKALFNAVNYFMYQKGVRGSFTVII
jgi:hypothetical protein